MIKPTSITALQTFFFINKYGLPGPFDSAGARSSSGNLSCGRDAPLLITFVRILAITDNGQQESELNLELSMTAEELPLRSRTGWPSSGFCPNHGANQRLSARGSALTSNLEKNSRYP